MGKKITIIIALTLIFVAVTKNISAQVPGYMGKNKSIIAESLFFPNKYGLKSTAGLIFSNAIKDNKCLTAEYHFYKDFSVIDEVYKKDYGIYYIRQNSFGIGYQIFNQGGIAPVGSFVKISFLININSVDPYMDFPDPSTFYTAKFGFSFGRNRIIKDKIIFSYGFSSYINTSVFSVINHYIRYDKNPDTVISNSDAEIKILGRDILNLNLGIGYIF